MNKELLTKRIRKVATDIADIANDIDNHRSRKAFFIDLIKQRIFELYDLQKALSEINEPQPETKQSGYIKSTFATDAPLKQAEKTPEPVVSPPKQTGLFADTTKVIDQKEVEKPIEQSPIIEEIVQKEIENSIPKLPNDTESHVLDTPDNEIKLEQTPEPSAPQITTEPDYFTLEAIRRQEEKTENEVKETELITDSDSKTETETPPPVEETFTPLPPHVPLTIEREKFLPSEWLTALLTEYKESKSRQNDITQKLQNTPVTNFATAISISQKHEYITELFAGNSELYKETLAKVEACGSLDKALSYLEFEIAGQFQWAKKEKLVSSLLFLISRRFI